MKIKSLDISNFRGIKKAKIDFSQSNLAVFIGTNGQGKSSILDLLAIFLNKISFLMAF
jgi:predicted ATP-dependent endonuclease of OLD family